MAVLGRGRYLGTFARYAVARLSLLSPDKPSLDVCAAARIEAQTTALDERMGEDASALFTPGFVPGVCLANELSGFGIRDASSIPLSRYLAAAQGS